MRRQILFVTRDASKGRIGNVLKRDACALHVIQCQLSETRVSEIPPSIHRGKGARHGVRTLMDLKRKGEKQNATRLRYTNVTSYCESEPGFWAAEPRPPLRLASSVLAIIVVTLHNVSIGT